MSDLLKGNFKTKKTVTAPAEDAKNNTNEEFRKQALSSIGGSMVYVERTPLEWDGEE